MNKLNVLVSLITDANDYQLEQAASAQSAAIHGASGGVLREVESAERYRNCVETKALLALGVRGVPEINPAENQLSTLKSW